MNRSVKILCTAAVLALGMAGTASAEIKIGFVNYNRLLQDSPQAKTALDAIRTEFAPREKDIQAQGAALKAREEKLTKDAATMSEIQRAAADKELRDGSRDLQRKQAEVQDDFNARRNEEMSRLQRVLLEEVGTYAKAQGFDLVLGDGVLYATGGIDITNSILTALQSRRAGAAPAAAPAARSRRRSPEENRIAGSPAAAVTWSLGELAVRFGCELRGDPAARVGSVAALSGGPGSLGFVASAAYRDALRTTTLGAVVLETQLAADCPTAALVHRNPHATFARIAALLHPAVSLVPGIDPTARIDAGARIDPGAQVGAFAVIGAGAVIGPRSLVGPHSIVGDGVVIDADTRLVARVTLCPGTRIGARCILHPGAVIGSDGFGNARDGQSWVKVPQVGGVLVWDDVEIGANTTIDRGALGDTVIEEGVRLDNQIQVGHNVSIGAHTAIAACTGIAGSTRIGRRCMIGGGTGIGGQLVLGDDIIIAGFGMVTKSIDKPGLYSSVVPVEEARLWRRIVGRIKRLDVMAARIRKLEAAAGIGAAGQENDD